VQSPPGTTTPVERAWRPRNWKVVAALDRHMLFLPRRVIWLTDEDTPGGRADRGGTEPPHNGGNKISVMRVNGMSPSRGLSTHG